MDVVSVCHHGAVSGVTGSCHQYQAGGVNLLVDCGLFQGDEAQRDLSAFDFEPSEVDALIVTHGHIDHVGRIPWLIAAGFRGVIICSKPTAVLLPIILQDALEIHLPDNALLVKQVMARLAHMITAVDFNGWQRLADLLPKSINTDSDTSNNSSTSTLNNNIDVQLRLQNAGHILGSAFVELKHEKHYTVFSGDLGSPGAVFVDPPCSPERADILVLESTYGDKNHHSRAERITTLAKLTNKALANGGTLLIPAFSLGRTQELLAIFEQLLHEKQLDWPADTPLPIILDSPLAGDLTRAYRSLADYWPQTLHARKNTGRLPLAFDELILVESHQEHKKLVQHLAHKKRPAIVIAASGMCQGGRIVNYLQALLPLTSTEVLFVGYQARGTLGAKLQRAKAGSSVAIYGDAVPVNADIFSLSGFSAHADQSDLIKFVQGINARPKLVRLVHGDARAKQALAGKLKGLADDVVVV